MEFVIILRCKVAHGRHDEFVSLVASRIQANQETPGLERLYLLRPADDGQEYRIVSWWTQLDRPEAWIRTEAYELSQSSQHPGIVVGPAQHEVLRVIPTATAGATV